MLSVHPLMKKYRTMHDVAAALPERMSLAGVSYVILRRQAGRIMIC
jgi:hypothetical protein